MLSSNSLAITCATIKKIKKTSRVSSTNQCLNIREWLEVVVWNEDGQLVP